jgi:hypothetical protein
MNGGSGKRKVAVLIDVLDTHAGAIQAVSTVVLVVITGFLFWVTRAYARSAQRQAEEAKNQVAETQRQRFDQHRPVVHPVGSLPLNEHDRLEWGPAAYDLQLQNVGTGVALIVCGVLFAPEGLFPPNLLSTRYTVWRESAILPGEPPRTVKLLIGKTKMEGDTTIGGYRLFAPRLPTQEERMMGGHYTVVARLTLTYQDVFMRKHAAVYDYIDLYGWQCVALMSDVPQDLEDMSQEVDAEFEAAVKEARAQAATGSNRILHR